MRRFWVRIGERIRVEAILLGVLMLRLKYVNLGMLPSRTGNAWEEPYLAGFDVIPDDGLSGGVLLEICAGLGYGCTLASRRNGTYISMDQSVVCAIAARMRGTRYLRADVTAMPLPDRSVDYMLAVEGLVCLNDPVGGLREAFRVLAPNGTLTVVEFRLGKIDSVERYLRTMAAKAGCEISLFNDLTAQARTSVLEGWKLRARKIRWVPWPLRKPLENFLCLPGTARFDQWENEERSYYVAQFRRRTE